MNDFGELIMCEKGHHYYASLNDECPMCKRESGNANPKNNSTVYMKYADTASKRYFDDEDDQITVRANAKRQPIAGWLVCIDGEMRGKDYRFGIENNFIGRDRGMDICLMQDNNISREIHGTVSYDCRTGKYYYTPGKNRNIDYINDVAVFTTTELKAGDILSLGSSKFVLVTLCGEHFKWEDWEEDEESAEE